MIKRKHLTDWEKEHQPTNYHFCHIDIHNHVCQFPKLFVSMDLLFEYLTFYKIKYIKYMSMNSNVIYALYLTHNFSNVSLLFDKESSIYIAIDRLPLEVLQHIYKMNTIKIFL